MGLFNKKQKENYATFEELVGSISGIALDYSKMSVRIENVEQALFNTQRHNMKTNNVIAGLVEVLKNTSTKKELSKQNKISDNETFTTEELYDVMLNLLK